MLDNKQVKLELAEQIAVKGMLTDVKKRVLSKL